MGGPSIIFYRYHEPGKTKIRETEKAAKLVKNHRVCQSLVPLGCDAEHAHQKLYEKAGRKRV